MRLRIAQVVLPQRRAEARRGLACPRKVEACPSVHEEHARLELAQEAQVDGGAEFLQGLDLGDNQLVSTNFAAQSRPQEN